MSERGDPHQSRGPHAVAFAGVVVRGMSRKVISNGTIVTAAESFAAECSSRAGGSRRLGDLGRVEAEPIDADGCLVLPGCIDSHTHLAQPVAADSPATTSTPARRRRRPGARRASSTS